MFPSGATRTKIQLSNMVQAFVSQEDGDVSALLAASEKTENNRGAQLSGNGSRLVWLSS